MREEPRLADEPSAESERRFRAIFDNACQLQLLLDLDGVILEANRAAESFAASTGSGLRGRVLWEAMPWDADSFTAREVRESFALACAGRSSRFEATLAFVDDGAAGPAPGRRRPAIVDLSLTPIIGVDGGVVHVLAEGRDLTGRKLAEVTLREISALTTLGRIAARVAHEINNPLAGIQNAFLLVRDEIPEHHPHYRFVGAIEREIARIAAVTRQLYETYRPDQSMAAESSVILAVGDAVAFFGQVDRARNVRIVTELSKAPSLVPVPDALIRQTLYNLVQNAVDASPEHGTVEVIARQEEEECVICVSDEGQGIPLEIRHRIFEPFFGTRNRQLEAGGMGIGLAIVRQSVLAVGGRIALRDRPGGGTEFEVRLPMTPIDAGALQ